VLKRGKRTLDNACVDVEEIVARHARLASDACRHGHEVAALERGVQLLLFRSHECREGGLRAMHSTRESAVGGQKRRQRRKRRDRRTSESMWAKSAPTPRVRTMS
jgi:hypothetical protein